MNDQFGMGKRAEIWDKARWDAKNAEVEADIEDIASEMEACRYAALNYGRYPVPVWSVRKKEDYKGYSHNR